jgi:hypothetical protein
MFDSGGNNLSVNNNTLQLLGNWEFGKLGIFSCTLWHQDVKGRGLCSQHLYIQAILAQVHLTTVTLVNNNGRSDIENLQTERLAVDKINRGDNGIYSQTALGT